MILFFKKCTILFLTVITTIILVHVVNRILIRVSNIFEFKDNVTTLILGDSHARYAFNSKHLDGMHSLSHDADSYFYSYLKLKAIKRKNKQINTVLLAFSRHNIERGIEDRWLLNTSQLKDRAALYYPIMDFEDYVFLFNHRPKAVLQNFFRGFLYPAYHIIMNREAFGGYGDLDHNIIELEVKKNVGIANVEFSGYSSSETIYLEKIKTYCYENNIKLVLVATPLHYLVYADQSKLNEFYYQTYSEILFLDFTKLSLADPCYGDLVHLSPSGSECFSKYIMSNKIQQIISSQSGHWQDTAKLECRCVNDLSYQRKNDLINLEVNK